MTNLDQWLKWAIGILIAVILIGAGIFIYLKISGFFEKSTSTLDETTLLLDDAEFGKFENTYLSGNEVLTAVKTFKTRRQFSIKIITGENPTGFYAQNDSNTSYLIVNGNQANIRAQDPSPQVTLQQMKDKGNALNYINPTGRFKSTVLRDSNDNVRILLFDQTQ